MRYIISSRFLEVSIWRGVMYDFYAGKWYISFNLWRFSVVVGWVR